MTEDELVEKVAWAMARQAYSSGGMERITDPYTPDAEYWNDQARAALAVLRPLIRSEVLEEAARLADTGSDKYATAWRESGGDSYLKGCSDGIDDVAAAIRALIVTDPKRLT